MGNKATVNPPPPQLLGVARSDFHLSSIIGSRPEYLFRSSIRGPVPEQTLGEGLVLFQGPASPPSSQLGGHLGRLVPEPPARQLLRPPARLPMPAMGEDRLPQLLHSPRPGAHGGPARRLPAPLPAPFHPPSPLPHAPA